MTASTIARRVRLTAVAGAVALILGMTALPAAAQDISINFGQGGGGLTERVIQLIALLTVLSLAPSILIMMTSFTRIVVVLSLLRTALGTSTAPPNSVMIALAMFLASERSNHISGKLIYVTDDWKRFENDSMKPEMYTLRRSQRA